ncbi:2Fe-2S iron-sulfur cluster-binding protein [Stenotrophomonas sp. TWI169]|nr:hypothetical protein [Stenotrophomonas maltophilia]
MTPWLRRLHRWIGVLVGLQFLVWLGSGLGMSLLDPDRIAGTSQRAAPAAPPAWPADTVSPADALRAARWPAATLDSGWLLQAPVYRLQSAEGTEVIDARDGRRITIDPVIALRVAQAAYRGQGVPAAPVHLAHSLETRGHPDAVWRVDFGDAQDTTVYVSADSGQVLEHRTATWRLFDVFWMLHIMDYAARANFNNPLVVGMGLGGLWMALTGAWLLLASVRLHEFVPHRWRSRRQLAVFAPGGTHLRTVAAAQGDSVYLALAREGVNLPSNCGGGQSCGLCEVRVRGQAGTPSAADRAHLAGSRLKVGCRLACNLQVEADMEIEVAGGASLWTEHEATVERIEAVTPFLREIHLRPDHAADALYQPGCYLQLHVPEYELPRSALWHPDEHRQDWAPLALPETLHNKAAVRRSYSLAMPVAAEAGRLVLLARFSPGWQQGKRHPPGKGSSYLYALRPGDRVRYSGPFGDFALSGVSREKIFIGAGAGMAPLRAMIEHRLSEGGQERIHYWYGARSDRDCPYMAQMQALQAAHANFSWHPVWSGQGTGRRVHDAIHEDLLQRHPDLSGCEFYLCGPPPMLAATRQLLQRLGVTEERIAYDDFKI